MKNFLFLTFVFSILSHSCTKSVSVRKELAGENNDISLVQEKDSPLLFMDIESKMRRDDNDSQNVFIYGTISNTAMNAGFKDVFLAIKHYSASNDLLDISEYTVRRLFEPNTRIEFEFEIKAPLHMHSVEVEIKAAKPAN